MVPSASQFYAKADFSPVPGVQHFQRCVNVRTNDFFFFKPMDRNGVTLHGALVGLPGILLQHVAVNGSIMRRMLAYW